MAVAKILAAANPFARLELEPEAVDVAVVRSHYRRLALAVHPDKCKEPQAKEAFQALSEAFEKLSSTVGQAQCLREAGLQAKAAKAAKVSRAARAPGAPGPMGGPPTDEERKARWWDTKTWEEFEERLRHRERAEAALRLRYEGGLRLRFSTRKMREHVRAAERSVEHLDRNAGMTESPLWPPESTQAAREVEEEVAKARQTEPWPGAANELLPNYNERLELNDPALALQRLLELLTHLRAVHRYCLFCGCTYDSAKDMDEHCPGITEEEHEEENIPARDAEEKEAGEAGEDPLEAYMASIDAEAEQQRQKGKRKKRP
ncbi:unnamed protein product [Symbiodinium natans]|uniref:J domain-containing protein n=1 Tax=Symbiodinium natans TaxID=878477 RepID=A0A812QVZ0_9DINO|nr:unnamed protein product [Symbiodinium natans]